MAEKLARRSRLGSGLPNAPVYRLSYNPTAKVLVAATIGRGAWEFKPPPPP